MKPTRQLRRAARMLAVRAGIVGLAGLAACAQQPPPVPPKPEPTAAETAARLAAEAAAVEQAALEARVALARQRAEEAWIYGYPLVLSEMYRQQMSGAAKPTGIRVPANVFWHARRLPPQGDAHPLVDQADALASFAWLDLDREAMLIGTPDMGRRFFSLSLHSQWTQPLLALGSGIADGKAARVLVAGPDWHGAVPAGARLVRSPTRHVLLSVRIQAGAGAADLQAVRALQARLRIVPQTVRSGPGRTAAGAAEPPALVVAGETPQQRLRALDTAAYFDLLARLLGSSAPPAAADVPLLDRIATIGVEPGKRFDPQALEPAVRQALGDTGERALQRLRRTQPQLFGAAGNGWQVLLPGSGADASDPLRRAALAQACWPGPPPPQQMLLLRTRVDAAGQALSGRHDYQVGFAKNGLPPVDAFWSLTLHSDDGSGQPGFVPDAGRIGLGTRDRLAPGADGALALFVQNLSPGLDDAARWLPAPKGAFVLTLRLYAPRRAPPSALPPAQGSWVPPAPRRVD